MRLAGDDAESLLLVMLVESDRLGSKGEETVLFESTSEHGLVRVHGQAVLEERDLVRFHVQTDPEVIQRRDWVRVRAPQPVVLALVGDGGLIASHSIDVSGGGMLLSGPETLELDDRVRFRLHLDDLAPPIKGRGRVVRHGSGEQRGIVFEEISRKDRERLVHFVFDRQRLERAKTRGDAL